MIIIKPRKQTNKRKDRTPKKKAVTGIKKETRQQKHTHTHIYIYI